MASSVSFLCPIKSLSKFSVPTSSYRCRKHLLLCCKSSQQQQQSLFWSPKTAARREIVFNLAFAGFAFPAIFPIPNALSDTTDVFVQYIDNANKFKISIPKEWRIGAGEPNGFKSVTAFYPDETSNSNVSVVITGLGPDFTRMESFGNVDGFAETLVGGLDRSWQNPPGVAAKLIDSKSTRGIYYIEYTLQNPGESRKHLFSALGMASNGWYNRLYTVTGQFPDEESEKFGSQIRKTVSSFKFI